MIVFFIENQQIEYEKCFSVMHFLCAGEEFYLNAPVRILLINDDEIKKSGYFNFTYLYDHWLKTEQTIEICDSSFLRNNIKEFKYKASFCLYVKNMSENDVLHLHYFELLRQYNQNCYLIIEPKNNNDYYRISSFYQIESEIDKKAYSHRFCLDTKENRIKRLALKNNNLSRRFLPLMRIDANTYSLLSKNIFEVFSFSSSELLDLEENNIINSATEATVAEITNKIIANFCIKLITEINEYILRRKNDFSWNKYKEQLSHISVLGLCYFLSYLHIAIANESFDLKSFEITHLLLQSEDFSMGTMQLLENALKHAENGYFCYRIHCSKDKKTYLKENYNIRCKDDSLYYLEVIISDFNMDYDIPKKFIQNIKSRNDVCVCPELLINLEKKLQLRDFFNPTDECRAFWQEYYADKSNIALHYGLNIFEQIVVSSDGRFIVNSSNNKMLSDDKIYGMTLDDNDASRSLPHIPGTQYKIILPIKNINLKQKSTGLKIQLNTEQLKKNWKQHTISFIRKNILASKDDTNDFIEFGEFKYNKPDYKESSVFKLKKIIKNKVKFLDSNTILVFDVKNFSSALQSEVFTKALICLLGEVSLEKIAIIHASHGFMSMFIRIYGLLYYKKITREFLSKNDLYICGDFNLQSDTNVEIIFKGNDINESVSISKQIADYKGEYSSELSVLENIAEKCEKQKGRKHIAKVFPFDVLIKTNERTLFQEKTIYDLNQDLQLYHFGCRLSDVHMKVGSKIHITKDFFEATLLFGIENYISRFAYLLAKKIAEKFNNKTAGEKIVLIGYETYSEILMIETKRMLSEIFNIETKYLIYDDSAKQKKFRSVENQKDFDINSSIFIIIVPIGSTLTTHDKISAELKREFSLVDNKKVVANLCVVLIRDELKDNILTDNEKLFWSSINESYVVLLDDYIIGNQNRIDYIVCVNNKWENPDYCKCCYPEDLSAEKPILKVNKASVIPMIMMGIKEKEQQRFLENSADIAHGDISELRNHMKYGHFQRGDNHFEYYFNTETLAAEISHTESFDNWLNAVKRILSTAATKNHSLEFNFVVAPQHSTNAEFVMQVNEKVFGNPASVIFLDVKKEYRDNVKTKFSNLTQLYYNLNLYGRDAVINFHYVDDTITAGVNFNRTKSLISSLFPENCYSEAIHNNVKVNVFSSVILLIGRCSFDTKLNYAPNGRFFNYYELKISSLRNHEDACVLCKKHNDYEEMRKLSSTNSMENAFSHQVKKYRIIKYNDNTELRLNDGYVRAYVTHELNKRLSNLGHRKNSKEDIKLVLSQLITDIIANNCVDETFMKCTESLCVCLLVISSPFASFRKSVLSASFELLLNIAGFLLFEDSRDHNDYLADELKHHIVSIENRSNKNELELLLKTVFECLSYLGSNFLMRVKTINSFFTYINKYFITEPNGNTGKKWVIYYSQIIIQTLMLNKQDSRVLWLEKILKFGTEDERISQGKLNSDENIKMLKEILILENTLILSDTLNEAVYAIQNTITGMKDLINNIKSEFPDFTIAPYSDSELNASVRITEETNTDLVLKILFDKNGQLRNRSNFIYVLRTTVQSYFCEAFRAFSNINNDSSNIEQLLDMSILYLLLLPNSSLFGAREEHLKFYDILVKQIKSVLKVSKIQLFMSRDKYIDFICSSDSNNVECDSEYESYLKDIICDNKVASIGETYYLSANGKCINAIRIVNNSLDEKCTSYVYDNTIKTAWYLVFEVPSELTVEDCLTNARNLLVMRENLLLRLKKDYDNNLYTEFSELRNKVKKLTDDKAGGHTPFAELSQDFNYLYILSTKNDCVDSEKIANYMKLITDLLISKLYVCHINDDSYPGQIETRRNDMQYNNLNNYKSIMMCAKDLVLRKENSSTIKPNISFDGVNWAADFTFMKKSEFIWISIFYALVMNALRHGYSKSIDEKDYSRYVDIIVSTDEKYLIISNEYVEHNDINKKGGITLDTVNAFLLHYGFDFVKTELPKEKRFTVKIPLDKEQHCEN